MLRAFAISAPRDDVLHVNVIVREGAEISEAGMVRTADLATATAFGTKSLRVTVVGVN